MNLIKKYKNLSAPVKASMWFLVCNFLQKGISMITTPIFTRLFTTEQYGIFNVYQSWYNIISIIAGLNLAAGVYTRGLIKNEDDQDAFSSSMLGLSTVSTLIFFGIYLCFSNFFNSLFDLSSVMMICMFTSIFMHEAFQFWSNRQRVSYKYKKLVLLTILKTVSSPIMGIIAVVNSAPQLKVEARIATSTLMEIVFSMWFFFIIFKRGKTFFNKEYWKYALSFNIPLIPHYLSQIVLNQSDRIMIKDIIGADAAGIYSLAYSLAFVMHIFNSSVSSTMNPWIYKNIKQEKYGDIARVSYVVLLLLAALNFALIAVAPEIISIMAPPSYASAVWVMPPIAASVFFMFMYTLFATFEYYFEKTKFVAAASFIGAALNVILNFIFLTLFKDYPNGFIAAGYTTLVCYICYALGHYYFMRRINKKEMNGKRVYDPKIILLISTAFLALSLLVTLLYPFPLIRFALILAILVAAFILRDKIIAIFRQMKKKD